MPLITRAAALCLLFLATFSAGAAWADHGFGRFDRDPLVRLMEDGETVKLLSGLAYTDPRAMLWSAPAGFTSNGASIPSVFWSMIGSPLSGRYRDAAIIHDYYCVTKERGWKETHEAFYHAMRARGVGETQAKIMYGAVYRFGPRWQTVRTREEPARFTGQPVLIGDALKAIRAYVESQRPSPEELRSFLDDLAQIETTEQLEAALSEHVGCTPVIETGPLGTKNRVVLLCGMNATDKRLAAVSNLDAMIEASEQLLRQQAEFVPTARRISLAPTPRLWRMLQRGADALSLKVKAATRATLNIEAELSREIQERVERILLLLAERTRALAQIRTAAPQSVEAINEWVDHYDRLRTDLQAEIKGLRAAL